MLPEIPQIVDRFRTEAFQAGDGYNRLRAMNTMYYAMADACREQNIPVEMWPTNFTLGTLEPRSFGYRRNGEPDEMEQEFADLAGEMSINPLSKNLVGILADIVIHAQTAWKDEGGPFLSSYDSEAKGTAQTRRLYLAQLENRGFDEGLKLENSFLCAGGMDGLVRTVRSLVGLIRQERGSISEEFGQRLFELLALAGSELGAEEIVLITAELEQEFNINHKIEIGFPVPGFLMAANAAAVEGAQIVRLPTDEGNEFSFPPDDIENTLIAHPNMGAIIITPFNNPTTVSWNPEDLQLFLSNALKTREDLRFVFDMAYFELVEPDTAAGVIRAIRESGAIDRSTFVFSRSKAFAQPRMRSGLIYTYDETMRKAVNTDTLRSYASFPWLVDLYDRALSKMFLDHPDLEGKYRSLLRKRQSTLLETLKRINQHSNSNSNGDIFEGLNNIVIPGDDGMDAGGKLEAQVPLYLWVKLSDGITAWDLARDYGIIAVPGSVFGAEDNYVRFSLGTLSCSDIAQIAENIKAQE